MRIDSHQHFWNYSAAEYPWIGAGMERLARDHLPADLEAVARPAGVVGSVAVQARQSLVESRWLLALAREHAFIRGVVGWVDLRSERVADDLAALAPDEKFVGVRHVVQDEADPRFLVGEAFVRGVRTLHQFGLTYDLLLYPPQLSAAVELVGLLPEQPFVLDHLGKPRIKAVPYFTPPNKIVGRFNVSDNTLALDRTALHGYVTREKKFPWREWVRNLQSVGLITGTPRIVLAAGTDLAGMQVVVVEFDLNNAMANAVPKPTEELGKVVGLRRPG